VRPLRPIHNARNLAAAARQAYVIRSTSLEPPMVSLTILTALFLLPTIIAFVRGHNTLAIFLLNFFFGWTVIGWFWALIWAVTDKPRVQYVYAPAPR
jgi:hypothetical protein